MPEVALVGKTNVGKSTLFSALTMLPVKIEARPFTTIRPNVGIAYLKVKCVCRELGVKDNPRNSICRDGVRYIPVKIIDLAGLIPGAHEGRGLGNKFLDEMREADGIIHVVDASGSTDAEGRPCPPGSHDPLLDVEMIEREVDLWIFGMLRQDWAKIARSVEHGKLSVEEAVASRLSGLKISIKHVRETLEKLDLRSKKLGAWSEETLLTFVKHLFRIAKPFVIAANKCDLPESVNNVRRLKEVYGDDVVIPCSAEAELALRRAAEKGLIEYTAGDSKFKIANREKLTREQLKALELIKQRVLDVWGSTGVQEVLNTTYFKRLNMIPVYPVADPDSLTDSEGNVLPDVYLVPRGTTARELAYIIHTELGESFIYAIDARKKVRLGEDSVLNENDVISIVAAKRVKRK
ncbi:MAG: redox-regulated ATPase YchF [Candidatus Nezhaarchaeales archaeon]